MNFQFIGWCKEQNHDKVWVLIQLGDSNKIAAIWGKRGRKLQFKIHENLRYFEIDKLIDAKRSKGYKSISSNQLSEVYPEFKQDLEKTTMWAMLSS
jgi:predicted DNA-binding WGR domain protein